MNKKGPLLAEIEPLTIIREVKKWPVLYVFESPDKASPEFRTKVWHEVAKNIFSDWDAYTKSQKHNKVLDLAKKWRNLRDMFKKQMERDKKRGEGHVIARKRYVYFKHMKFLTPHLQVTEGEGEGEGEGLAACRRRRRAHPPPRDEDRHFALSLVPSLKKMTDDEKLSAKVKILKVIKEARTNSITSAIPESCSMSDHDEVEALDNDEVEALDPDEVEALDPDEVEALDPDELDALEHGEVDALDPDDDEVEFLEDFNV